MMDELLPRLVDVGGIAVIAVLLVWRIDTRMARVECAMKNLRVAIEKLVWKLEG